MNLLDYQARVDTEPETPVRAALSSFLENGYLVVPPTDQFLRTVAAADAAFIRFKDRHLEKARAAMAPSGHLVRVVNLHCAVPELASLFTENPALPFLDRLFGEATLYTSLFFEKGSAQDFHRDTPYFWTNPGYRYVGLWVALEATDTSNGPLMVVPGAHKLPEPDRKAIARKHFPNLDKIDPYSNALWMDYQTQVQQQYAAANLQPVELHVPRGSTVIWHPQMPHGGKATRDEERSRKSLAMHITPPDTAVHHQDAFFSEKPVAATRKYAYRSLAGRRYIAHDVVSMAHKENIPVRQLG